MKKLMISLVLLISVNLLFAQTIDIIEAPRLKNNGTYMSYLFELPNVEEKQAEEEWKKFMGEFKAKTKYDKKNKIWVSENAVMPKLSDGTVDVYTRILEDNNPNIKTTVIVWYDLGESFVSSDTDSLKSLYAQTILSEFAMSTSKEQAEVMFKVEKKRLEDLEKELSKLKKENKNYRKEIEKAKESISKNERNIEINELDHKKKEKEIEAQKGALRLANDNVKKFVN